MYCWCCCCEGGGDESKIDDEFKITEAFAEKEKEYSKLEDIHINFNLSKDIELSLTSELDETKEDSIYIDSDGLHRLH